VPLFFALTGFVVALAAGPIVALPAAILSPPARAFGMGVFYAIYYGLMMTAPPLAGAIADRLQNVDVTLWLGAGMLVATLLAFGLYRRTARVPGPAGGVPDGA
jgi:hypothetical protein